MSLKQFVWNLAGAESEIPDDELPDAVDETEVQPGDIIATNSTRVQDDADPAGIPNVDIDMNDDANASFGSFLTTLVGGGAEEAPTPQAPSPGPTPKQEKSFFGSIFSGAPADEVVEQVEPTTPPQSPSFIGSLFGGQSAEPVVAAEPVTPAQNESFIGSLFGGRAAEPVSAVEPATPPQNESFIGSLFGSGAEEKPAEFVVVDEPSETQSFLGSLFGSRAPSPDVAIPEPDQVEEEPPAVGEPANEQGEPTPLEDDLAANEGGETTAVVGSMVESPANDQIPEEEEEPQSFFGSLFGAQPEEPKATVQEETPAAEEAQSFMGSLFGSRAVSPEPAQETFFGSLFAGPAQEEPLTPPQPSSPDAETTPVVAASAPPVSFFGSLLGGQSSARPVVAASDEPVPEEIESEEEQAGFGSFLTGLVTGTSPEPNKERRPSKLGQLVEELASPSATVKTPPIQKMAKQATAFDNTEADDEVERIEKLDYVPKSKRLTRLLVENEADAQLKLGEAEIAMALLRRMQKETDQTYSKPNRTSSVDPRISKNVVKENKNVSSKPVDAPPQVAKRPVSLKAGGSQPVEIESPSLVAKKPLTLKTRSSSAAPPKKNQGWNIFGFTGSETVPPKADVPKLTLPKPSASPTGASVEKVSKDMLDRARAVLKKTGSQKQVPIVSKILHREKEVKKSSNRAQHSFEPVDSSFSTRFSQSNTDPSASAQTELFGKPSVIVTSIEARTVHRSRDAWEF